MSNIGPGSLLAGDQEGEGFPPRLPQRRMGGAGERVSAICCARSRPDQADNAAALRAAFFGSFLAEQERTENSL